MKRIASIFVLIASLMVWNACAQDSSDGSDSSETEAGENTDNDNNNAGTERDERLDSQDPNERQAAARATVAAQDKRRRQMIAAFANPESPLYANAGDHRADLKKLAANDPVRFQRILANVNNLRDLRGRSRISAEQLTSAGLRLTQADPVEVAVQIAEADQNLGACLAAQIGPANLVAPGDGAGGAADAAGGGDEPVDPSTLPPEDLPEWAANDCPERCVCAAAHAWAEAEAYATCSDGSFGYGYGWAEAWAYAYACLPEEEEPDQCEEDDGAGDGGGLPEPNPCEEIDPEVADPMGGIVEENLDCFLADGGTGNCGLIPDPEPSSEPEPTDAGETGDDGSPAPDPTPSGDPDPTAGSGDDDDDDGSTDGSLDPSGEPIPGATL